MSWLRERVEPLTSLRVGTVSQRVLGRAGDDTSIDWGYLYIAAPTAVSSHGAGASVTLANEFTASGAIESERVNGGASSGTANGADFALAFNFEAFQAGAAPVSRASHDRI